MGEIYAPDIESPSLDNVALIDQRDANLLVGTIKWTLCTWKDRRTEWKYSSIFPLKLRTPSSIPSVSSAVGFFSVEKVFKLDL